MVPIGGSMRLSLLKNLVFEEMKCVMKQEKPLCMTVNMDEDISAGACRMSHLFVENRLLIDSRLKDKAVFQYSKRDPVFGDTTEGNQYFITCTEAYLEGIERNRWHSLDNVSKDEEDRMRASKTEREIVMM